MDKPLISQYVHRPWFQTVIPGELIGMEYLLQTGKGDLSATVLREEMDQAEEGMEEVYAEDQEVVDWMLPDIEDLKITDLLVPVSVPAVQPAPAAVELPGTSAPTAVELPVTSALTQSDPPLSNVDMEQVCRNFLKTLMINIIMDGQECVFSII